jgi:uridine phosphorylase
VFTFFGEVIRKLVRQRRAKIAARAGSEAGPNHLYEIRHRGRRLAIMHPGVGGALAAGYLEEAIAFGCRKFIAVGGAGSLHKDLHKGALMIPTAAVRDEGTSYHYLPAGRTVKPHATGVRALERVLRRHKLVYAKGHTWTTDGFYRETHAKVRRRAAEGCLTVEMEAASFFAVAKFRRVPFAQLLYRMDDVSGITWDGADMHGPASHRERVFWLAAEACLSL